MAAAKRTIERADAAITLEDSAGIGADNMEDLIGWVHTHLQHVSNHCHQGLEERASGRNHNFQMVSCSSVLICKGCCHKSLCS